MSGSIYARTDNPMRERQQQHGFCPADEFGGGGRATARVAVIQWIFLHRALVACLPCHAGANSTMLPTLGTLEGARTNQKGNSAQESHLRLLQIKGGGGGGRRRAGGRPPMAGISHPIPT